MRPPHAAHVRAEAYPVAVLAPFGADGGKNVDVML
jgi:hypothetical protein